MRARERLMTALLPALLLAGCNGHLERTSGARPQQASTAANGTDGEAYDDAGSAAEDGAYAGDAGDAGESDRTLSMEQQAFDLEQQYQDARATARTPEEAERAYQEFERKRAELNATGDEGAGGGDAYGPPP